MPCSSLFDEGSLFLHQPGKRAKMLIINKYSFVRFIGTTWHIQPEKEYLNFFLSIIYLVS